MKNGYAIVADDIIRDLENMAWKFNWNEDQLNYMIWELKNGTFENWWFDLEE